MTNDACVRLWAPRATRVELVRGDRREPMVAEDGGWFRGPVLADGEDYAFSVDGGDPRPDPRSRWQPNGVHGPSRWMALPPRPARCTRAIPLRDAVIYELHLGTFSEAGTYRGAIEHLDYLVELGITHVEVMPIAQFPGTHGWGYDGVDLFAPHAGYGTPADFVALVEACHLRGLAVIVDVVHNHFGPEGDYTHALGPYRTSAAQTPWGDAINLDDDGSAEVRRFLIDSALAWLRDYGCDGLRLDAVHSLVDRSERHFVAQLVDEIRALEPELDRPLVVIGEYDSHDPIAIEERPVGWGLDAHWNDDFHHAVHVLVTGETAGYYIDFAGPDTLARVLERGYALDGRESVFRRGPHGQPLGDLPRDRLVAYVQSHDQVGNRAAGERLHQLASLERAKIAAALLFVSPFVPMVFQGEEWAASAPFCFFCDFSSRELQTAVREGRKREHEHAVDGDLPDPCSPQTRDRCVLAWDERARAPHSEMLAWYRALIALRRDHRALRDPSPVATRVSMDGPVLLVERCRQVVLAVNLGAETARVPAGQLLLSSTAIRDGALPPDACAIVLRT
ncbi:MAG: malto-oligosyltrehalose trehalohydrolase [Kofleriaceae bacterium]